LAAAIVYKCKSLHERVTVQLIFLVLKV